VRPDTIVVENLPAARLAVNELSRTVVPGWLRLVCGGGPPFDLTFLIRPTSAETAQQPTWCSANQPLAIAQPIRGRIEPKDGLPMTIARPAFSSDSYRSYS
jgi:hypothetical protein